MIKVVLDTNVLVSSTIVKGKQYKLLGMAKKGKIKLMSSFSIISEFEEVISRKKFGYTKEQVENAVKEILNITEIVIPDKKFEVIKEDPEDNKVLEAAFCGKVDYVISGDEHLLNLKKFKRIKIVNATKFFHSVKIRKRKC